MNQRRLRGMLRRVLPEGVKKRLRGRLFGYRTSSAGADWSLVKRDAHLQLQANGVEAVFPESAGASLAYHCLENGDSIDELNGFLNHAKRGAGTLIDVGAADGLFCSLFCLADANNRAVAYEPSTEMYEHLVSIAKLNDLSHRITAVNAAVGRSTGMVAGGLNSVGMLIIDATAPSSLQTRMVSLDDQIENLGIPTVIKIDVEGYEGEVLHGAQQLLAKHRPTLFLEFHLDVLEQQSVRAGELLQLLIGLGYQFESSVGTRLSARQIATSPKAIIRFVAWANDNPSVQGQING